MPATPPATPPIAVSITSSSAGSPPSRLVSPIVAPKVIIMVSGWLKSGKDTIGEHLVSRHGFHRLAFATVMKNEVATLYGLDRESLDTQAGKDATLPHGLRPGLPSTVRGLLIQHAEEERRRDPEHWARRLVNHILLHSEIVVTDFRFPTEFHVLRRVALAAGAKLLTLRIERWSEPQLDDPTERGLDDFNFDEIIDNRGTMDELFERVDEILVRHGVRDAESHLTSPVIPEPEPVVPDIKAPESFASLPSENLSAKPIKPNKTNETPTTRIELNPIRNPTNSTSITSCLLF